MSKTKAPLLKVESLTNRESDNLTSLARIDLTSLDRIDEDHFKEHKHAPFLAERIEKLRAGLTTPFAKQVAAYILGEASPASATSDAERTALQLAQTMMLQVQPGYREKFAQQAVAVSAKSR